MAKSNKEIRKIAAGMAERYAKLHKVQAKYEAMGRLDYQLPSPLREIEHIRSVIDTSPYDAKRGVTRALSNLGRSINVHPITVLKAVEGDDDSKAAKLKANEWETTLKWVLDKISRRKAAMDDSVIDSAATYHEIVAQVIHVPTQFKLMGAVASRKMAALRLGDWAFRLVNPQTVDVDYSDYMPERVCFRSKKTAREIVDFWGDAASAIQAKINREQDYAEEVLVEIDYVDYEDRMVWIVEENADEDDEGIIILGPEPWLTHGGKMVDGKMVGGEPVPFLPLVAVASGTDIDIAPEHQRKPLFYPIVQAEQWANANIIGSIAMSKPVMQAFQPDGIVTSPRGEDGPVMDWDDPAALMRLMPGETYEQLRQKGLDPALTEALDRYKDAIQRATVSDVLVTGQPMGGVEAGYGYNLQLQVAISSLGDYKHLGERFYESAIELMLLLAHYTGQDIVGYGDETGKYTIGSEDIDPEVIHVMVELKTDVPADRQQRVNTAAMMARDLNVPTRVILTWLGESDPEGIVREWEVEQMDRAYMAGLLQKIQMEGSGELQQLMEQLQQYEGMMEQLQQAAQPQGGAQGGMQGVGGAGFDPAQGGQPPAGVAPSATRENQTGSDFAGNELAGV